MNKDEFIAYLNYLAPSFMELSLTWQELFIEYCQESLIELDLKLTELNQTEPIFPPQDLVFNAFAKTPLEKVSVVIVGQDPYHGKNEANGLAFAVNKDIRLPSSLRNILHELKLEYGIDTSKLDGSILSEWAKQGVLLLNSTLNVIENKPNSLESLGWQKVTDKIITLISQKCKNVVFLLWGSYAKKKASLIKGEHLILTAAHPSFFSAHKGFFGCNHFKLANQYLVEHNKASVSWF